MASLRTFLLASLSLGLCVGTSAYADYLRSGATYTFDGFLSPVTLPNGSYPEWSVFNAFYDSTEASGIEQTVGSENGKPVLEFDMPNDDPTAFLALGIRAGDSATEPLPILELPGGASANPPAPTAYTRTVSAKVKLVGGGTLPDIETFTAMYSTADEREGEYSAYARTAAKLGLVVAQAADGNSYLYVTRVRFVTEPDTDKVNQYWYEFCQTSHQVKEGDGLVDVEILCRTILLPTGTPVRAYMVMVDGSPVTDKIGYTWGETDPTNNNIVYTFNHNSLGKGPWLFAIDEAEALIAAQNKITRTGMDTLTQIGFSANNGAALASASVQHSLSYQLLASIDGLQNAGPLAQMAYPGAVGYDLYERWVSTKGGDGLVKMSDEDERVYDEFLMDMVADRNTAQRLTVTGLTVEPNATGTLTMTLTVLAPEGAVLDKNSLLCVRRAETLDGLETAQPARYASSTTVAGDGRSAVISFPVTEDNVDKPFLKVTAEPRGQDTNIRSR